VWTYYEATSEVLQSRISAAVRHHPELRAVSEYFDLGMRTWKSQAEIAQVDEWLDSHETQIHASLMQTAREEQALIIKLNGEHRRVYCCGARLGERSQQIRPWLNKPAFRSEQ
jgi:hypothetical protein